MKFSLIALAVTLLACNSNPAPDQAARASAPRLADVPLPCHREGCGPTKSDPCACRGPVDSGGACFPTWEACMADAAGKKSP